MKTIKLKSYHTPPSSGVANNYPTNPLSFTTPTIHLIVGPRGSGKSFIASKYLIEEQRRKNPTFDQIYLITPTYESNKKYWQEFVPPENAYYPNKDAIDKVIERIEDDRQEWEDHLAKVDLFENFKKDMKRELKQIPDDSMLAYLSQGFFDSPTKPVWKYHIDGKVDDPPKSMILLDDVMSSPVISSSSSLGKISILNRHIAPLEKEFTYPDGTQRSALGAQIMALVQTYKSNVGTGSIPLSMRENTQTITLFEHKNEKALEGIFEEVGNILDRDKLEQAYKYAVGKPHGSLTISLKPKIPELTFRSGLDEALVFEAVDSVI